jgi:hypothetical protein
MIFLTILADSLADMLRRFLRGIAGGAPKPGLVESRRRFFRHLKARNAEKATYELETHLTDLHELLKPLLPNVSTKPGRTDRKVLTLLTGLEAVGRDHAVVFARKLQETGPVVGRTSA